MDTYKKWSAARSNLEIVDGYAGYRTNVFPGGALVAYKGEENETTCTDD